MNFKLKALVAAAVMVAASSANAASTGAASTGSSLIFSAWDDNGSYSLDLGNYLNDFIGVDTATSTASGSSFVGAVAADGTIFDTVLNGFNLTSGVWNLAAADTVTRYRMMFSNVGTPAPINSQVKTTAQDVGSYIGIGAAASTTTGTLASSTDLWYANGATWGDNIGGLGITGTSNALGSSSDIYVAWQNSVSPAQATVFSGLANLTAGGQNVFATTYVDALGATHFKMAVAVAAVPEADTSAMMLAGLGLMGLVARRRNRKQA
jgi:hypothetical protein